MVCWSARGLIVRHVFCACHAVVELSRNNNALLSARLSQANTGCGHRAMRVTTLHLFPGGSMFWLSNSRSTKNRISCFFAAISSAFRRFSLIFVLCVSPFGAVSAALDEGMTVPLLTLHADGQTLELTQEQLLALPQQRITTTAAWLEGTKVFEGPLVRDVLALLDVELGATTTVTLRTLDDYEITVSLEDYLSWDVIIAHSMDGTALSLLDYGPLWVVYPRDDHAALQDSRFDHRWAWMLNSITVKP